MARTKGTARKVHLSKEARERLEAAQEAARKLAERREKMRRQLEERKKQRKRVLYVYFFNFACENVLFS